MGALRTKMSTEEAQEVDKSIPGLFVYQFFSAVHKNEATIDDQQFMARLGPMLATYKLLTPEEHAAAAAALLRDQKSKRRTGTAAKVRFFYYYSSYCTTTDYNPLSKEVQCGTSSTSISSCVSSSNATTSCHPNEENATCQ